MFKKLIAIALVLSFPLLALSQDTKPEDIFDVVEQHRASLEEVVLFDSFDDTNSLTEAQIADFQFIAVDQARVWGDTILEGDYHSKGDTHLTEVIGLYLDKKLLAYKVSYAETAWYTGSCEYDYENDETLEDCQSGSIQESSLVSPDFKYYIQDDYAEFYD